MRVGVVILPIYPREEAVQLWSKVEAMGFDAAYTYDHLAWRSFRGGPWYGSVPMLATAALVTERIRIGPLVSSPNFRHPVPFAAEIISLDELSGGRLTVGIGAGADGHDLRALGQSPVGPGARAQRFAEFTSLLDALLTGTTNYRGAHYQARDVTLAPGCVQRPRVPFSIAATGPRGMRVVADYANTWITYGRPKDATGRIRERPPSALREQISALLSACEQIGRDPATLACAYLVPTPAQALSSVAAYVDLACACAELGMTEFIIHVPVPETELDADLMVFDGLAEGAIDEVKAVRPKPLP